MNLKVISGAFIVILILGISGSSFYNANALGRNESIILKKDLKSIMNDYQLAIEKAREDFVASIKKANHDAKLAVKKGIPMDEINSATKSTISKARADLKLDIQQAKIEAKTMLLQLKAAVDRNKLS
ncbi:MAG: hypothetical protein ACT4N5_00725 [Nitrosopumilaceae archaeon]